MTISKEEAFDVLCRHVDGILDLLHDGVYISDAEGRTIKVNAPYEQLTGMSEEQLKGENVYRLRNKGVFNTIVNPEVVATKESVTLVQEVNERKVVLHGHPVLNSAGEVELVVTFVRDITAFDRLRNEIAEQKALVQSYQRQIASLNAEDVFQDDGMVAVSEASLKVLSTIENIAPTDAAILILGETGVGKDIVARKIHKKSLRAEAPFYKVDCTTIPESLVESVLFGYAPGAFSGARSKGSKGFFEKADKGTLFLDEIGELSLVMQTKLLRAIQDQEINRVGSTTVIPVDVRIVAATNRDLEEEVREGRFRSDLYYRLKVAVLELLPLRERKDDILPLVRVFLHRYNEKYNKAVSFCSKGENMLLNYDWPGNVRELENLVHSIVVSTEGDRVKCRDLPSSLAGTISCPSVKSDIRSFDIGNRSLKEIMRSIERDLIRETLAIYGSVSKAAEVLQVDRSTLFRKTKAECDETEKKGKKK
jgi:PAS domain S-box-containing protein